MIGGFDFCNQKVKYGQNRFYMVVIQLCVVQFFFIEQVREIDRVVGVVLGKVVRRLKYNIYVSFQVERNQENGFFYIMIKIYND